MPLQDDRTPVFVGAAQWCGRDAESMEESPVSLMARVARSAAEDAGLRSSDLRRIDTVGIVDVLAWRPKNAANLLGSALAAHPAHEWVTAVGGESPLRLTNHVAGLIRSGESKIALLAGCNQVKTLRRARKLGTRLDWPMDGDAEPKRLGVDKAGTSPTEAAHGMMMPTDIYPIFENALRARRGVDLATHQRRLGELFAPFTQVAAGNPNAWFPKERSAAELSTASTSNRMIGFPYPKFLNAVLDTDQAAGVLMMSAGTARELGIPEDRWAWWWGGAHATEEAWFTSERPELARSPALAASIGAALERARTSPDEIDHFDLYSCFPVAVELACEVLGIAEQDPRGLTVTGGLPYHGGPGNNYALHGLAEMIDRVRNRAGSRGLVTGNGWYLTKHSATVVGSLPPRDAGDTGVPVGEAPLSGDGPAAVEVLDQAEGAATVDGYTVTYDRDGPVRGIIVGRLDSGPRFVANTATDRRVLESMTQSEVVGRSGRVRHTDGVNLFELE